jgi:hypothetical protein
MAYVENPQKTIISFMQFEMLIMCRVSMMREGNHDLCGVVTELHGFCGR